MSDRSAIHTIKGYFYQFDYTILQILNQENTENVLTLEEIEDLDIETADETTAVQCKYYEKTDYNHSIIAKPIRLMLEDFIKRKRSSSEEVSYKIYGYYKSGQDKLVQPINVEFLKSTFLTYQKEKVEYRHHELLQATDNELEQFILNLDIDIDAFEYNYQLEMILEKMIGIFECDSFEAENYYYNNALNEVKKLSIEPKADNRKVTKSEFLEKINKKKIIFNKWFIKIKGKKQHLNFLRNKFFCSLNLECFDRFFLIEISIEKYSRADLIDLMLVISNKYSKITKRTPERFCPFIFISELDKKEIIEIKKYLRNAGRIFIDGYDFQGSDFSVDSMLRPISYERPIHIKFLNNRKDLEDMLLASNKIVHIYQFYLQQPFFYQENDNMKHVKIEIEEVNDIKGII